MSGLEIGVLVASGGWRPGQARCPTTKTRCSTKTEKIGSGGERRGGTQLSKLECKFFYPLDKYIFIECPPHFKHYSESSKCH